MAGKKYYKPIVSTCKECGKEFQLSPEEQSYFDSKRFVLPKRCKECRELRKTARKVLESEEKARLEEKNKEIQQKQAETDEKELGKILESIPFPQIQFNSLTIDNPLHTLVVLGNGFDIMHGVKSSYWDFQKTLGKNNSLRFNLETYLNTNDLWSNLEESLGKLQYTMFLNRDNIDMWLDDFGAYDPDAQAADFFAAVETAISPAFEIPHELKRRLSLWVKTLSVDSESKPFSMFHGDYRVLCFNYTEFIEVLYGAKASNICYIHGCRKSRKQGKSNELILGHRPGEEADEWNKVELKSFEFKNPYKKYIMDSALETAVREAAWYDDATIKNCSDIIKQHSWFFNGLSDIEKVFVFGHSLSEVDYPYFKEISQKCNAEWYIGFHSSSDIKRLLSFVGNLKLSKVTVFRT